MIIKYFTLKFNTALDKFDDSEVQEYIKDKNLISVENHFFVINTVPYLLVIITCNIPDYILENEVQERKKLPDKHYKKDDSWKNLLDEKDMPLFRALQEWRNSRAKKMKKPAYIICKNDHLAELANKRPATLAGIGKIRGFGETKVQKYGKEILSIVSKETGNIENITNNNSNDQVSDKNDQTTNNMEVKNDQITKNMEVKNIISNNKTNGVSENNKNKKYAKQKQLTIKEMDNLYASKTK